MRSSFSGNNNGIGLTNGNMNNLSGMNSSRHPSNAPAYTPMGPSVADGRSHSTELQQDLQGLSRILPKNNKTVVKSGAAGAFNPRLLVDRGQVSVTGDPEDGHFIDRTTQELMIEQKLIPIDESTVMQEIIDDRHQEIVKVSIYISFSYYYCLFDYRLYSILS
jgi:hypothetical protein